MSDQTTFSVDSELDLSGAGLQEQELDWLIADVGLETTEDGIRWSIHFEPLGGIEVEGLPGNKGRESGWLQHSNAEYAQMGQGILKRIYKAVLGRPNGKLSELKGKTVRATVKESETGFAQFRKYKPVPTA